MTWPPLLPDGLPPGPLVVGATGGSGTRAVARLLQRAGVWIGGELNDSLDAVPFGLYSNRWIDAFLTATAHWRRPLPATQRQAMLAELAELVQRHLAPLATPQAGAWQAWGWKEPRSMYLLPLWVELFPSLRFLHLLRDGRDMALSSNQNQLRKHGEVMLGRPWAAASEAERSIALWSRANAMVARFGQRHLQERYRCLRFEDLCAHPEKEAQGIADFFSLAGDLGSLAAATVVPPPSLGRWRGAPPALLKRLERIAAPALVRFGYPVPARARLAALLDRLRGQAVA